MNKKFDLYGVIKSKKEPLFFGVLLLMGIPLLYLELPHPTTTKILEIQTSKILLIVPLFIGIYFLWKIIPIKFSLNLKSFIESLFFLIVINLIVSLSGGVYSYFSFLYFLPVLYAASRLPAVYSTATSVFACLIIFLQLINGSASFAGSLSLIMLTIAGIWLFTAFGRTYAKQLEQVQEGWQKLQVEQLRQLDKLKDEFVFIIAHELRSPITAIRGYLELIITDKTLAMEDSLRNLLQRSFSTSTKLSNLVGILLEVARIETGKIRFYNQKVDLRESLDFVVSGLENDRAQKEIQLINKVEKENFVLADKERVEEIITMVLNNALEFTAEYGQILITSQSLEKEIILSISDTGIGIPEERIPTLFEKYYIEDPNSGAVNVKGYGISLFTAKQLLLLMNGDINCESVVGKGSTFNIHLPKYWSWEN